jgi:hypothetical protein
MKSPNRLTGAIVALATFAALFFVCARNRAEKPEHKADQHVKPNNE